MSTGYTIHVSGLAPESSETKLQDFFSFCGKLQSVKKHGTEADITFEKQSAMRTALMLNGGTLDGAHLEVTAASPEASAAAASDPRLPSGGSTPIGAPTIDQEDKPKAAIAAEYLAHGYTLGDNIIQKAIDVDQKQGISSRFLNFLHHFDKEAGQRLVGEGETVSSKLHEGAHNIYVKTREADQQHGVSNTFLSYYQKALSTPVGKRVSQFYNDASKTIVDVHEEAKRLAEQKKGHSAGATPPLEGHDAKATEAGFASSVGAVGGTGAAPPTSSSAATSNAASAPPAAGLADEKAIPPTL